MYVRQLSVRLLSHGQRFYYKTAKIRNYTTNAQLKVTMTEGSYVGKPLIEIVQSLESFAPLSLAENWDNVGLLVDPIENQPIKRILLTNDLTEGVLEEGINLKVGLIISYHPNIFQGLKSVSSRTWKERIVVNCIKNKIAVYSPHTSWDAVQGGVNDWLCGFLPLSSCLPIKPNSENNLVGSGRICKMSHSVSLRKIVDDLKLHIGIPYLRVAIARSKDENDTISSVAVCAGSGASVLNGIESDLYITGEMFHHDVLDATQKGIHVILCNHSDSERGFLRNFSSTLQNNLLKNTVEVLVSKSDFDPLKTM